MRPDALVQDFARRGGVRLVRSYDVAMPLYAWSRAYDAACAALPCEGEYDSEHRELVDYVLGMLEIHEQTQTGPTAWVTMRLRLVDAERLIACAAAEAFRQRSARAAETLQELLRAAALADVPLDRASMGGEDSA